MNLNKLSPVLWYYSNGCMSSFHLDSIFKKDMFEQHVMFDTIGHILCVPLFRRLILGWTLTLSSPPNIRTIGHGFDGLNNSNLWKGKACNLVSALAKDPSMAFVIKSNFCGVLFLIIVVHSDDKPFVVAV